MSESDKQFVDRMTRAYAGPDSSVEARRLFALARRGAEAALSRAETLKEAVNVVENDECGCQACVADAIRALIPSEVK